MNTNIGRYLNKLDNVDLDRSKDKYYEEIQQLAYNLVRYLKMNDNPNEHSCQGNYNLTYLIENMTNENFEFIVIQFLKRISLGKLRNLINENFTSNGWKLIVSNEIEQKIKNIEDNLCDIKNKLGW